MIEKPPVTHSASSGDLSLDRRYAWAEAALKDGDARAAVEILDQTLAQAGGFVAAWHLYGLAREALGHHEDAATAWRQCLDLDPADHFGARLDLARIGAMPAEQATSENFAGTLFDGYAERFDSHLTQALDYTAPALLMEALRRLSPLSPACGGEGLGMGGRAGYGSTVSPRLTPPHPGPPHRKRGEGEETALPESGALRFGAVYDLGCGTGLMGEAIREAAGFLAGCDLSPRMIERARAKTRKDGGALYDKLAIAGLTSFLVSRPDASADLVVAADVFVYLGELGPAFAQSARVLKDGGLLAFTTQSHEGAGVIVGADRRFAHAEPWLLRRLAQAGLAPALVEAASTRRDRGQAVPGLLIVARKA